MEKTESPKMVLVGYEKYIPENEVPAYEDALFEEWNRAYANRENDPVAWYRADHALCFYLEFC